jgi:hypothetical protein
LTAGLDVFHNNADDIVRTKLSIADPTIDSSASINHKMRAVQLEDEQRALIAKRLVAVMGLPMARSEQPFQ